MSDAPRQGLWREADSWTIRYEGRDLRLTQSRGLAYLAELLRHPGREIHALELAAVAEPGRDRPGRPAASQAERARKDVSRAINEAIRHVAEGAPAVGAHLERAVRTGTFCSYAPDPEPPFPCLAAPPAAPGHAPAGTVTFMLTDVEGSTRLLAEHPAHAGDALRRQADLIGDAVARLGGTLLKGRGEGDSTFSVFSRASDALACALELTRALEREPWSDGLGVAVRVGLHAGEAEPRQNDYHGLAVNRCARIRDAGHGGQVLVSLAARELIGHRLPEGADLLDLGAHRLRDLERPERLFQLVHHEIRADFPPLRSAPETRHNLPARLTTFVGRERELEDVARALGEARLVTLTGAGGSGKTRLATEVAALRHRLLRDGAWLVELAPVFDDQLVPKALARALGVRERPRRPVLDDVVERLRSAELLLVLDNCEHLADAAALLADRVLREAPDVRILATSREPLGVPGETVMRMASLAVPDAEAPVEAIEGSEAVRLFADRARAASPRFELGSDTAPLVAQICRRLDGLPLAIELAAARTGSLSMQDLASRLDDCFALLTGGARTALPRQRTLEATVAWSYDLLTDRQRAVFDRLTVFAGGFALDAAGHVCAATGLEARVVPDEVAALVDKSLVVRDELGGGRGRYRLLETLRQYGRNRLHESGAARAARDAHLNWAVALCEEAEPHLEGLEQAAWLDRLEVEIDNLRAALEWALASGNPEAGIRLVSVAAAGFWIWRSHVPESRRWFERALAHPSPVHDPVRAKGLLAAGRLAFQSGDWRSGEPLCAESAAICRAAGDPAGEARALIWQAINRWGLEDSPGVEQLFEQARAAARRSGRPLETALALGMAGTWWALRDPARAEELVEEAGRAIERAESPNWLAHTYEFRAIAAHLRGDHDRARELLGEALPLYERIGNRVCGAHCMETTAAVAAVSGDSQAAAELLAAAGRLRDALGTAPPSYERVVREGALEAVGSLLDAEVLAARSARGRELGFEEAMERARSLCR